ncbi:MAG: 2Fe-2S iron-sulfur cluster-binding protein [Polyangiales bacterium]
MPPRRVRPLGNPVTLTLDGEPIAAEAGAPIATALVGAGALKIARSPKFHRSRGPSCMRGGCDGCLMRVDGVPNVMTCLTPAREGQRLERQNVALSADLDVLRAADWFFPNGMNHHELLAGVPGVQHVMQGFARRVSGLGDLPDRIVDVARMPIETRRSDVLVIGGGPSGLLAAQAIATRGHDVMIVDEHATLGGSLLSFPLGARLSSPGAGTEHDVDAALAALVERAEQQRIVDLTRATAIGVLEGDDWLIDRATAGLLRVHARAVVIATGGHDVAPMFGNNDLPGVVSARAAGRLLRDGVLIGQAPLVVGRGAFSEAFAHAATAEGAKVRRVASDAVVEARGMSSVSGAIVKRRGERDEKITCDAIVVEGAVSPCFELASQAGATTHHLPEGHVVAVDPSQRVERDEAFSRGRPLFAVGEVIGSPFEWATFAATADRLARAVDRELSNPSARSHADAR